MYLSPKFHKRIKITTYRTIFEIIYIVNWNNLYMHFLLGNNTKEALVASNSDVFLYI